MVTLSDERFDTGRRKPRIWLIALVVVLHLLLFYGLLRAFTPAVVDSVERSVISAFTMREPPPPSPPPSATPSPDEGASGEAGRKAVARPRAAPSPKIVVRKDPPAPKVASTGTANSSGAKDTGEGTGASNSGAGTGSGGSGSGQGGFAVTKPVKIAGDINSAADFPVPPGGRQVRFGTSVTVVMTVGTDGRAHGCRVIRPSPDPQADAIVCKLAEQRFRFRPARDANGNPVAAPYGWRQEWFAR